MHVLPVLHLCQVLPGLHHATWQHNGNLVLGQLAVELENQTSDTFWSRHRRFYFVILRRLIAIRFTIFLTIRVVIFQAFGDRYWQKCVGERVIRQCFLNDLQTFRNQQNVIYEHFLIRATIQRLKFPNIPFLKSTHINFISISILILSWQESLSNFPFFRINSRQNVEITDKPQNCILKQWPSKLSSKITIISNTNDAHFVHARALLCSCSFWWMTDWEPTRRNRPSKHTACAMHALHACALSDSNFMIFWLTDKCIFLFAMLWQIDRVAQWLYLALTGDLSLVVFLIQNGSQTSKWDLIINSQSLILCAMHILVCSTVNVNYNCCVFHCVWP